MGTLIDLTGKKYGKLTVIKKCGSKDGHALWECVCDCGKKTIVRSGDLRRGKSKSCGCVQKKHGGHRTRLYRIWGGMKTRCYNKSDHVYPLYGGRGITICPEWRDSFETFRDWAMANGYQEGLTIDRIDVNEDYKPENCRWVTVKEQENNRRNNRKITFKGETKTLSQWSAETGINRGTIQWRLNHGWTVEKALSTEGGSNGK